MKPISQTVLAFCIACIAISYSCSKTAHTDVLVPADTSAADVVDPVIGTYTGYYHFWEWSKSSTNATSVRDTTYLLTVSIIKTASDSFSVTELGIGRWESSAEYKWYPNIGFNLLNEYSSLYPFGQFDTMVLMPHADSIWYKSTYNKPGGSSAVNRIVTFSGKRP
jgi:hypothetical protein